MVIELAKQHLDVGLMVHDWDAAQGFWAGTVGLPFEKFEKIGGGVRQYRFGVAGTVVKVNHSRQPLGAEPTIYRRLRIALPSAREPTLLADPEGVEVEVVPPGHEGVAGIEITAGTRWPERSEWFWAGCLGAAVVEPGRFRIGDTLVRCVHEPGLTPMRQRTGPGLRYLTVQVPDVDATYARLTGLGVAGEIEPFSLGQTARVAFVRDPDGGFLEVSERAEVTGRPIRQD